MGDYIKCPNCNSELRLWFLGDVEKELVKNDLCWHCNYNLLTGDNTGIIPKESRKIHDEGDKTHPQSGNPSGVNRTAIIDTGDFEGENTGGDKVSAISVDPSNKDMTCNKCGVLIHKKDIFRHGKCWKCHSKISESDYSLAVEIDKISEDDSGSENLRSEEPSPTDKSDDQDEINTRKTDNRIKEIEQIKQMAQLRDEGILTEEEFQEKKSELLKKM